jgi:DOPA 4,5-dioxygenase
MPETADTDTNLPRSPQIIHGYHAHIYYDPSTSRVRAAKLREHIAEAFPKAVIGRWHDVPVGPHSQAMYQVAFDNEFFPSFVPWLMLNRDGLAILVHPQTGNSYADHVEHSAWLGAVLPLRLDVLRRSAPAA